MHSRCIVHVRVHACVSGRLSRGGDEPIDDDADSAAVSPTFLSYQFHGRLTATTVGQCFIHLV